jgi:hypothetical protein
MELPEDVLVLIRQYAKPCFKYFREYKVVVQVLGKDKWHPLKRKLLTHGDEIVPILMPYLDAYLETKRLRQALLDLMNPLKIPFMNDYVYFMARERQVELFWVSRKLEDSLYRQLVKVVYGVRLPESEIYTEQS